jgi:hypothetical protein
VFQNRGSLRFLQSYSTLLCVCIESTVARSISEKERKGKLESLIISLEEPSLATMMMMGVSK